MCLKTPQRRQSLTSSAVTKPQLHPRLPTAGCCCWEPQSVSKVVNQSTLATAPEANFWSVPENKHRSRKAAISSVCPDRTGSQTSWASVPHFKDKTPKYCLMFDIFFSLSSKPHFQPSWLSVLLWYKIRGSSLTLSDYPGDKIRKFPHFPQNTGNKGTLRFNNTSSVVYKADKNVCKVATLVFRSS